jgi:predicted ABC-type ATPase
MLGEIHNKKIIILAGPNGAGKTTFARSFLPTEADCPRFINADLIAAGLAPFAPETASIRAARLMLQELARCTERGESFAFETTLAGRGYLRQIEHWRQLGYFVSLFFLTLPSAEMAINRVAARVRQGGHHIDADVIRRRFLSGQQNFNLHYRNAVDLWPAMTILVNSRHSLNGAKPHETLNSKRSSSCKESRFDRLIGCHATRSADGAHASDANRHGDHRDGGQKNSPPQRSGITRRSGWLRRSVTRREKWT